ncbi:MAG: nucleotide sugar dehydrogenase [Candidatus Thermoplasmatota archaeon]|nr:nucleotide sugar dehydrogenase [Candidatus Thermoplasmatota archaeon]
MKSFDSAIDKISVIGLGYVGLPLSLLLARKFHVIGFDTDTNKIEKLRNGINPITEPGVDDLMSDSTVMKNMDLSDNSADLKKSRMKIITVGTPYDPNTDYIDYSQLNGALDLLRGNLNPGDFVVLKSTVPPGTTNSVVRDRIISYGFRIPEDVGIAFSPERMVEGQAIRDFTSLPKIIGASDPETSGVVAEVIGSLGGSIVKVSSPETAEMVKMVDNYSRYVFLGLTNEIALISEKVGVDVLELIKAAKHEYPRNAGLMIPGPGVGGSCLNKDPFILKADLRKKSLNLRIVDAASEVNRSIPKHIADMVTQFADGRRRVVVAGVAFKGDTDDTRFTPAFEIADILRSRGFEVIFTDPFVNIHNLTINHDMYESSLGSEILLLLTDHSEYGKLDLKRLKSIMGRRPLIIDTRGIISRDHAIDLDFQYHGYGRL